MIKTDRWLGGGPCTIKEEARLAANLNQAAALRRLDIDHFGLQISRGRWVPSQREDTHMKVGLARSSGSECELIYLMIGVSVIRHFLASGKVVALGAQTLRNSVC